MSFFVAKNIIKNYANHRALDDVSIEIPEGAIYGLLGPNGAGKTSLIRIINQITGPDSGELYFKDHKLEPADMNRIGYLPEERGLYKKMKIGVHAYGNVGQNVGRIAKGFGMEVYAFDPFMTDEQIKAAGATPLHSAEEMYAMCDYVSLHIPATEKTKKSINYELLNRMPKGAVLINTARKEVINEEELVKLMADRPDFKYISDIAPDNAAEYAQFEGRYFFTPKKMGAQTEEANVNAGLAAARQIVAFLEHGDAKFKVNK